MSNEIIGMTGESRISPVRAMENEINRRRIP